VNRGGIREQNVMPKMVVVPFLRGADSVHIKQVAEKDGAGAFHVVFPASHIGNFLGLSEKGFAGVIADELTLAMLAAESIISVNSPKRLTSAEKSE